MQLQIAQDTEVRVICSRCGRAVHPNRNEPTEIYVLIPITGVKVGAIACGDSVMLCRECLMKGWQDDR